MKKILEIDWNNPSDIKKNITLLQKRRKNILRELGYDQIWFNGSKYNLNTLLPLFNDMVEMDFNNLYENTSNEKEYYVYFHCNPLKPLSIKINIKHLFLASKYPNLRYEPFYVGKGKGNRYLDLNRNGNHRKIRQQLIRLKTDVCPIIIKDNLDESSALSLESKIIDILGLTCYSNNGMLVNLDEGIENNLRRKKYNNPKINKILKSNGFV